jgi:hypothetical protein
MSGNNGFASGDIKIKRKKAFHSVPDIILIKSGVHQSRKTLKS